MDIFKLFTDPLKLIKFLLSAKQWTGTHNGKSLVSVEKIDAGLNGLKQRLWVSANFHDGTAAHKLMGSTKVSEPGTRGGDDNITLDTVDVANDDVVIGTQLKFPHLDFVLAYKFDTAEGHHRYEFKTHLV